MLTLVGLLLNLFAYLLMMVQDTTLAKPLPPWTYVIAAICAFLYQTLDAVDGKQARRTKTSGPLGQLFDHGCDAIANTVGGTLMF